MPGVMSSIESPSISTVYAALTGDACDLSRRPTTEMRGGVVAVEDLGRAFVASEELARTDLLLP